jgi:hypothetical protein
LLGLHPHLLPMAIMYNTVASGSGIVLVCAK